MMMVCIWLLSKGSSLGQANRKYPINLRGGGGMNQLSQFTDPVRTKLEKGNSLNGVMVSASLHPEC